MNTKLKKVYGGMYVCNRERVTFFINEFVNIVQYKKK